MYVEGDTPGRGSTHYYQYAQKVFEFGEVGSTVGAVHWGLGALYQTSFRTLFAEMADEAQRTETDSFGALGKLASTVFWKQYSTLFKEQIARAHELEKKGDGKTEKEKRELEDLLTFSGGFCLAGRCGTSRRCEAVEVTYSPLMQSAPQVHELDFCTVNLSGWPNLMERLTRGMDFPLFQRILDSGKWSGTPDELLTLVAQGTLGQPYDLPVREAIDWVYASLYITIKAMKFSHFPEACGGPIEIAFITTDRPFRWVRHKQPGEAIGAHRTREDRL